MTATEPNPTAEHIDAVAGRMSTREWGEWSSLYYMERAEFRDYADAILTSTDPAVHEALAANLPADVMLDALVRAGVLVRTTITANNATVSILAERIEVAP